MNTAIAERAVALQSSDKMSPDLHRISPTLKSVITLDGGLRLRAILFDHRILVQSLDEPNPFRIRNDVPEADEPLIQVEVLKAEHRQRGEDRKIPVSEAEATHPGSDHWRRGPLRSGYVKGSYRGRFVGTRYFRVIKGSSYDTYPLALEWGVRQIMGLGNYGGESQPNYPRARWIFITALVTAGSTRKTMTFRFKSPPQGRVIGLSETSWDWSATPVAVWTLTID